MNLNECYFCEGNIGQSELIACKSCNNKFHIPHLSKWLTYRNGCPDCLSKAGFIMDKLTPMIEIQ